MIEYLTWESNFFNIKVGKVAAELADITPILVEKKRYNYDRIFYFSNEINLDIEKQILEHKGYLADIKVIYRRNIDSNNPVETKIVEYDGKCTEDLKLLAIQSGHQSRFSNDPLLLAYFEKMYITWIQNSLNKTLADAVLIYKSESLIKAFVTLSIKEQIGSIGLIAVNEDLRGQGIGAALINASLNWLFIRGCNYIDVATQQANVGACRFYEKSGFYIKEKKYIYHL